MFVQLTCIDRAVPNSNLWWANFFGKDVPAHHEWTQRRLQLCVRFNHTKGGFQASEQAFLALEAQARGQQGIPADQPETMVLSEQVKRLLDGPSAACSQQGLGLVNKSWSCFR